MLHIYCGDGKGKTTAAAGLCIRAAGAGLGVIFAQFMKTGKSSELNSLMRLPEIEVICCVNAYGFVKDMEDAQKEQLRAENNRLLKELLFRVRQEKTKLLVLDEIISADNFGLLDKELLDELLKESEDTELVLTGREPDGRLLEQADYITEMKKVRHPYDKGKRARKGIEF